MVLLFQRFTHHSTKTNNKMKPSSSSSSHITFFSSSLQAFESEILHHLYQLSLQQQTFSFSWLHKCLGLLPNIDRAFAKFIVEIDYPVNEWSSTIVEEYLTCSSTFLDHLNSISSSISHLDQQCMKLSHALITSPLKLQQIVLPYDSKKLVQEKNKQETISSLDLEEKEIVVHRALLLRKEVKTWICRIVNSTIRGDTQQYSGVCNTNSSIILSSLQVCVLEEMKRRGVVEEVGDINKGVAQVIATASGDEAAKELQKRVEMMGKVLEVIKKDVNRLFSEGLARRNELLDTLEGRKH